MKRSGVVAFCIVQSMSVLIGNQSMGVQGQIKGARGSLWLGTVWGWVGEWVGGLGGGLGEKKADRHTRGRERGRHRQTETDEERKNE